MIGDLRRAVIGECSLMLQPGPGRPLLLLLLLSPTSRQRQEDQAPIFLSPPATVVWARPRGAPSLHCRVSSLGPHTVSWIRQADLQILSVGGHIFSSDPRLSVQHHPRQEDTVLTLQQVEEKDLGVYECQVGANFLFVEDFISIFLNLGR